MVLKFKLIAFLGIAFAVFLPEQCNNPYRKGIISSNYKFDSFGPKAPEHFDPAISYVSSEYTFICQIYEPPLQYHILKRPYMLEPLTAVNVPEPQYYDQNGTRLPHNVNNELINTVVYKIQIKPGILYQPHPCFAKKNDKFLYHDLNEQDVDNINEIQDFPITGTRELKAADYVRQIKRLSDPRLSCQIYSTMIKYIIGLEGLHSQIKDIVNKERKSRKAAGGIKYNQQEDELDNPIFIDYDKLNILGAKVIDDYTFQITLKQKYPQLLYWLAMPFFSPMPNEALSFYAQGVLAKKGITLDNYPVGTGAFYLEKYDKNLEIILAKNPNYHDDFYPSEGNPGDKENGLLNDANKKLPFLDKAVFQLEREGIPRWNKFLQGYYDASGIMSDVFDQAVKIETGGTPSATGLMAQRGINLQTVVATTTYYFGFNMNDDVVGGYSESQCKLRQAISIALNSEEYIKIFNNNRGIPGMSPIPPGIFGYSENKEGLNMFVYDWNEKNNSPKRKSIAYAKQLLNEAGYSEGRNQSGDQLTFNFDNAWTGASSGPNKEWIRRRISEIGINVINKTTDWNRFQEKLDDGNVQMFFAGWNADYPDPENFYFLLYGPNSKMNGDGENKTNYNNKKFNELFEKIEHMDNNEERLLLIKEMNKLLQHDAPWVFFFHPVSYSLIHNWYYNTIPNSMANNSLKYRRLNPLKREAYVKKYNKPNFIPLFIGLLILIVFTVPAIVSIYKKQRG